MVIYIKNWTPTQGLARGSTPHEAWFGEGEWPDLSHLQILGCNAHIHVPKEKRKKLDDCSINCRLVGYNIPNIYRLWDPKKKVIVQARDVVFNENSKGQGTGNASEQPEDENLLLPLGISSTAELNPILAEEISSDHQEQLTMEQLTVKQPVAALPGHPRRTDCANLEDSATADAPALAPNSDCPNSANSNCANQQGSAIAAPPPNRCSD